VTLLLQFLIELMLPKIDGTGSLPDGMPLMNRGDTPI
jgi:hypothetical protein